MDYLSNKAGIYNAVNKAMEKAAERTGYLKQHIDNNHVRQEIYEITNALYNGRQWTERIDAIKSLLVKVKSSGNRCNFNDREKPP